MSEKKSLLERLRERWRSYEAVSWSALMAAGGVSVVGALIAAYALATATSNLGVVLTAVALTSGLVGAGTIAWAAHDWREATGRMESHTPVVRHHERRLREGRSDAERAKKLRNIALDERDLLIRAGAHRQARDMTAAIAELEAAMHDAR